MFFLKKIPSAVLRRVYYRAHSLADLSGNKKTGQEMCHSSPGESHLGTGDRWRAAAGPGRGSEAGLTALAKHDGDVGRQGEGSWKKEVSRVAPRIFSGDGVCERWNSSLTRADVSE